MPTLAPLNTSYFVAVDPISGEITVHNSPPAITTQVKVEAYLVSMRYTKSVIVTLNGNLNTPPFLDPDFPLSYKLRVK